MKGKMKRLLAACLSLVILLSSSIGFEYSAYASTSHSQTEAVSWAKSKVGYKVGDGQCVALTKAYYEYLGVTAVRGNGCDYASNALPSGWQRIKYYSGFVAQPGDIAVWTYLANSYGHVAIVVSANSSTMNVVDQGATYGYKCHSGSFSYSKGTFYGVIRPDFNGGGSSTPMVKPTISISKTSYSIGESISFSWSASSSNSSISHYWLNIDYNGNSYISTKIDKSKNTYSFTPNQTGNYFIKVFATPSGSNSGEGSLTDEITITVVPKSNLVKPTILLNKSDYTIGETITFSWVSSSSSSNLSHYWLNIDYNNNPYISTKIDKNTVTYSFTPNKVGSYFIKIFATPVGSNSGEGSLTDEIYVNVKEKHTHAYTSKITREPTCTTMGVRTFTCACGSYYTENIQKKEHNFSEKAISLTYLRESATCTSAAVYYYKCATCTLKGTATYEYGSALGHNYEISKIIKPTYSQKGYTVYVCSNCRTTKKGNYKEKLTVAKPTISKVTSSKSKQLKVTWNKKAYTGYQVQIATDNKFTKNRKSVTIKGADRLSKTFSGLKGKTKYYVRVRAYKVYNGKKYYSNWSKVKSVTIKK